MGHRERESGAGPVIGAGKKIVFALMVTCGVYLVLEFLSFSAFSIIDRELFSFQRIHAQQNIRIPLAGDGELSATRRTKGTGKGDSVSEDLVSELLTLGTVLHPYLGFVLNPDENRPYLALDNTPAANAVGEYDFKISRYGFFDSNPPFYKRSPDRVIVGILGGSVALAFSVLGTPSLEAALKASPEFAGKEIIFVRLALMGHKEPQQLLTISYLLSLGAEFDMIINLDGFNEVALHPAENAPLNTFAAYPRSWSLWAADVPDPLFSRIIGEITYLKSRRRELNRRFADMPFRYSVTVNLVWRVLELRLKRQIADAQMALHYYKRKESSYLMTGPARTYADESEMFSDLVSIWKQSSLQLHRLCGANNITYFQFLQPNQYLEGSKKMGSEETARSVDPFHIYKRGVEQGYPMLMKEGRALSRQGVHFHDLSMIFATITQPLYIDTCCHLNLKGNKILGREIGKLILDDLEARQSPQGRP